MRAAKITFVILAAALLAAGISTTSYAFHSGGVAECEGCHSMHSPIGEHLLVADTATSTCLVCHGRAGAGSYHIATPPADLGPGSAPYNITPGGDFGWLEKTYTFLVRGNLTTDEGTHHGHDINAGSFASWGNDGNTNNEVAPGGDFLQSQLGCQSCHDPHGRSRRTSAGTIVRPVAGYAVPPIKASGSYPGAGNEPTTTEAVGVYRLLAGDGYPAGLETFPGVPAAKVPSSYNASEATIQTRAAYGVATSGGHATWGEWCATCHGDMHSDGNYVHPVDTSMVNVNANYNAYVKSGDMTGTQPTSFLSLTPFATNSDDYAGDLASLAVRAATSAGPVDGDQVMCLSCHRAHASGFPYMLRFGYEYEFMTKESQYTYDSTTGRGRTEAEMARAYGDRPAATWATYQRVLCNKCHAKD